MPKLPPHRKLFGVGWSFSRYFLLLGSSQELELILMLRVARVTETSLTSPWGHSGALRFNQLIPNSAMTFVLYYPKFMRYSMPDVVYKKL